MNKRNRKTVYFNIVDVLIVLCVIAAGAIMWIFFSSIGTQALPFSSINFNQTTNVNYVVMVSKIDNKLLGNIDIDDELYSWNGISELGDVVDIITVPSVYSAYNQHTGKTETYEYEDYSNMYITINSRAKYENGMYYITSNFPILVGKQINFKNEIFVGSGYCTEINVLTPADNSDVQSEEAAK